MKKILICLLLMLPFLLSAQVQKKTRYTKTDKTVQQKQVQPTKVNASMKIVQPVEPVDPVAEARQKAFNWLSPFLNYHMIGVEGVPTLKSLDLSSGSPTINGVSRSFYMCDDSLVHLLAFSSLESITLPTWSTNAALVYLGQMNTLKTLGFGNTKINQQGIASLPSMPSVERVLFYGIGITNSTMQILNQKFPSMKVLNIGGTSINDQGLAYLDPSTNLEIIMLTRGNFTDACIPTLLQFSGLKTIGTEFTQISAAGRQQLRDAFPNATIIPSGN